MHFLSSFIYLFPLSRNNTHTTPEGTDSSKFFGMKKSWQKKKLISNCLYSEGLKKKDCKFNATGTGYQVNIYKLWVLLTP